MSSLGSFKEYNDALSTFPLPVGGYLAVLQQLVHLVLFPVNRFCFLYILRKSVHEQSDLWVEGNANTPCINEHFTDTEATACDDGWTHFQTSCYLLKDDLENWASAEVSTVDRNIGYNIFNNNYPYIYYNIVLKFQLVLRIKTLDQVFRPVNSFTQCGFNSSCLLPDSHVSMCLHFGFHFVVIFVLLHNNWHILEELRIRH